MMEVSLDETEKFKRRQKSKFHYASVPDGLLEDKRVSDQACRLYLAYHSFSSEKNLERNIKVFVSQSKVAKRLKWTLLKVKRTQEKLEQTGWIYVTKRKGTTNLIALYSKPKKKGEKN